jgi:pimeloyl-ACP methyl ester carboxylesterase
VAGPDDHVVRLMDGRAIAYLDLGPPDGPVVLSCHGGLSSRFDARLADAAAHAAGVRIISPDRPGVGRSGPVRDPSLGRWPLDVVELTARLGVARFSVVGWSLGGCYAAAVAHDLRGQVDHLGLVASVIPPDWSGMRDGLSRMDRFFLGWCERAPSLDRAGFRAVHTMAAHSPKRMAKSAGFPPAVADTLCAAIAEGTRTSEGPLADYRIMGRPWGFDPAAITVPTTIWQGDADTMVPVSWGRRLADAMPNATLALIPGGTHYLPADQWPEILAAVVDI